MNIFLTSPDPVACAVALDDRRVIKMALETAQLLSVAIRLRCGYDELNDDVYGMTHYAHPCARWARKSMGNFLWLVDHGLALCDEYRHRYMKTHKSQGVIEFCRDYAIRAKGGYMTLDDVVFDFNSSADKHIEDVFLAYQTTMMRKWLVLDLEPDVRGRVHPPRWSYRRKPDWYNPALIA